MASIANRRLLERRKGRTPFRMELKFTEEEWAAFGQRANDADTSRYNFAKRAILGGAAGAVA